MNKRARILSVVHHIPRRDLSSAQRRSFAILELLAQSHHVDLFVTNPLDNAVENARCIRELQIAGVNLIPEDSWGWFRAAVQITPYDLGIFEYWYVANYYGTTFRQHQPWATIVVDSIDVHFLREEGGAKLGVLESAGVEAGRPREIATYEAADAVIAITEDDRRTLETLPGIKCIYTIPNIVPLQSRSLRNRQKELLFVGIFNHAPNPDGLLWFVHCVWPKVRARVNDAILTVIGRFAPAEIQALDGKDGISILGYVPETASYLDRAAISIAPLRFGAGMKGKVTEALASGVPVVTTTIGAQGFGIVSGVHALVANDPENFAANIVQLLNDEVYATKIGCAGRELVAELCSPEKVASQLNSMVAELLPSRRPQVPLRWWREAFFVRFRRLAYAMLKQVGISSSSRPTTQFSE